MGGNLFTCRRVQAEEYQELTNEILGILKTVFGSSNIALIKAYHTKPSFGDVDILISLAPNESAKFFDKVNEAFPDCPILAAGHGLSFLYKDVQVDLITVKYSAFKNAQYFYGYNDLGGLLGVMAKKLGITYGFQGIELNVYYKNKGKVHKLLLNEEYAFESLLNILGLDFNRYKQGFETLEDVFEFVASSKFFDPDIYKFENRTADARNRDSKRTTYISFLTWIEFNGIKGNYQFKPQTEFNEYGFKEPYFTDIISKHYPDAIYRAMMVHEHHDKLDKFYQKFNGNLVMEWTGLSGPELGKVMKKCNELLSEYSLDEKLSFDDEYYKMLVKQVSE